MKSARMSGRKKLSLETVDDYEQHDTVNTPRSLEACYREGIDPSELLFRPPEAFQEKGLSPRIQELNYNLYESKRMDSLALARQTRGKIIQGLERSVQKSYSESKLSSTANFQTQIERLKEKKVRAIREMVNFENQTTETLFAAQERDRKRRQLEESRKRQTLKIEKEKIDQKRLEDEKEYRDTQRKEKSARKRAAKELRKKIKEEELRKQREAEEAKERAEMIQKNDEKFRLKLQIAEDNFLKDKMTLEQRLAQEEMMDIERKKGILKQQQELKTKLKMRSREIEQKRRKAIAKFEKELEARRKEFNEKKSVEERKSARFVRSQEDAITKMRFLSQEKDEKTAKVLKSAAQIEEEKRQKVLKKMETIDKNVKRQREVMMQHLEFKKHINMLKELKKEWNIRRKQRKDEYLRAVSEEKLKQDDKKVKEMLRDRTNMIRSLTEMNHAADLKHYQLKEAVHNMAITKKWSPHKIEKLAGGSVDLTGSTRNTARASARPFTAGV